MKKWQLSKKKMLGFLTAGAIVVTMAGSYAVCDQLSDSASGTVTLRNKIEVAAPTDPVTYTETDTEWGTAPVYKSAPININATGVPTGTKTTLALTATVYKGTDTTGTPVNDVEAVIKDGNSIVTESTFNDETAAATGKDYTVEVTPTDAATSGEYTVVLSGELSKATTP